MVTRISGHGISKYTRMNLVIAKGMLYFLMRILLQPILLVASIIVSTWKECLLEVLLLCSWICSLTLILLDYDMRGYTINVAMAEKSAPRAPPAYGHGYALLWLICAFMDFMQYNNFVL